jgi:hypothetical protein
MRLKNLSGIVHVRTFLADAGRLVLLELLAAPDPLSRSEPVRASLTLHGKSQRFAQITIKGDRVATARLMVDFAYYIIGEAHLLDRHGPPSLRPDHPPERPKIGIQRFKNDSAGCFNNEFQPATFFQVKLIAKFLGNRDPAFVRKRPSGNGFLTVHSVLTYR